MFRACMEATAYGFRNHVDAFTEAGVRLGDGRVSNGGSGSLVWKQILADVLGTELTSIVDHGGASLGAALVAAVGSGALPDWAAAAKYVALGQPSPPGRSTQSSMPRATGCTWSCSECSRRSPTGSQRRGRL